MLLIVLHAKKENIYSAYVSKHKYMDDLEKFNETLPEKEDFYGDLNMEDITGTDYAHTKKVCRISWFVCSKWYTVVSWYIWEL